PSVVCGRCRASTLQKTPNQVLSSRYRLHCSSLPLDSIGECERINHSTFAQADGSARREDRMRPILLILAWSFLASMVDIGTAVPQQEGRTYRIGWLSIGRPGYVVEPAEKWTGQSATFRDALRDGGYVLGKNLVIEIRQAEGDVTRLAALAESLVA